MASLTQIAKKAGVSITAASLVLNKKDHGTRVSPDCAKKIRSIAKELGYVANYHASSIKKGRSDAVALAIDIGDVTQDHTIRTRSELSNPYFGLIIGGVEEVMRKRGQLLTLVGPDAKMRAPDRGLFGIRQRRFDGMVIIGPVVHLEESRVVQDAPEFPIVVIEPPTPTKLPCVDYDEAKAVALGVQHLAALGHKSLIWLGPPPAEKTSYQRPERHRLFSETCRKVGVRCDVVFHDGPHRRYDDVPEAAEAAMTRYLRDGHVGAFTGVVAQNDNTAIGIMDALQRAGLRVPQDISIVGHDDFEGRRMRPRLTSIDHRMGDMGRTAAEMLLRMQAEPEMVGVLRGKRELVEPKLVVRESTAAAKT